MKYLHVSDPEQEIPRFWTEEWLQNAIKKLDVSKMSPQQRALFEIGKLQQKTVINRFQKEMNEALSAAQAKADKEKTQLKEEANREKAQLLEMKKQQKEGILKALKRGKLSKEEIAEDFGVSLSYIEDLYKDINF